MKVVWSAFEPMGGRSFVKKSRRDERRETKVCGIPVSERRGREEEE